MDNIEEVLKDLDNFSHYNFEVEENDNKFRLKRKSSTYEKGNTIWKDVYSNYYDLKTLLIVLENNFYTYRDNIYKYIDEDFIKKYGPEICEELDFVPECFKKSKYLFEYYCNKKDIDCAVQFIYDDELLDYFSKEEINNYYDEIIDYFKETFKNGISYYDLKKELQDRINLGSLTNRCIEEKYFDILSSDSNNSKINEIEIDDNLYNKIVNDERGLKFIFRDSKKLLNILVEKEEWNYIFENMDSNVLDEDFFTNNFSKFKDKVDLNNCIKYNFKNIGLLKSIFDNISEEEYNKFRIDEFDYEIVEPLIDNYGTKIVKAIEIQEKEEKINYIFLKKIYHNPRMFEKALEAGCISLLTNFYYNSKRADDKSIALKKRYGIPIYQEDIECENYEFITDELVSKYYDTYIEYIKIKIDEKKNKSLVEDIASNKIIVTKLVEKKQFDLMLYSKNIDSSICKKYYSELKNELIDLIEKNNEMYYRYYLKSVDLLVELLKHNDYDLAPDFYYYCGNDEKVKPYYEDIVDYYGNDISTSPIMTCSKFIEYCLNNHPELLEFISYNSDIEKLISSNLDKFAEVFETNFPQVLYQSPSLLKYLYNKHDNERLKLFDWYAIDELEDNEETNNILEYLATLYKDVLPPDVSYSKKLFKFYMEKKDYSKIEYFNEAAFGCNNYELNNDAEEVRKYFMSKLPDILNYYNGKLPECLSYIGEVFDYCVDNDLDEYLLQFNKGIYRFIYSTDTIDKIINAAVKYNDSWLNENVCVSIDIRTRAKALERWDIFMQCQMGINKLSNLRNKDALNYEDLIDYSELLDISVEELVSKIEEYGKNNDEILSTMMPFMLEKWFDNYRKEDIEKIILYPDLQFKLAKLEEKEIKLMGNIFSMISSTEYDYTGVIIKAMNNIPKYNKLIENIDINDFSKEQYNNLIILLQNSSNLYNIESVEQLNNLDIEIEKYYDSIKEKIKNKNISLDEIKTAIFDRKFGLSMEDTKFICDRYCHDMNMLSSSDLDIKVFNILRSINEIYTCDNIEVLEYLFINSKRVKKSFNTVAALESSIRSEYAKEYNKTLYKVKDEHKLNENNSLYTSNREVYDMISDSKYNDIHPDIYLLDGDFNLQIHALGAYRDWDVPENFKDDWLRPKIAYHGICTSYIGNDQLANARANHPIYGFDSYEESALLCAGNYDLFSDEVISRFDTSAGKPYHMFPPKDMIDNTRHTHNEFVIERRNIKENNTYKRVPSYVVYLVDDINNKDNFSSDNMLYQETLQASVDQGIPIVIVDRLKCAKEEKNKINNMYNEFLNTKNYSILSNIFIKYFNNIVGCHLFVGNDVCKYNLEFNVNTLLQFIDSILNDINKFDLDNQIKTIKCIIDSIELENKKRDSLFMSPRFLYKKLNEYEMKEKSSINLIKGKNGSNDILKSIADYYYSQNSEVQEMIYNDIANGLKRNEIMYKINNNLYEGNVLDESRNNRFKK